MGLRMRLDVGMGLGVGLDMRLELGNVVEVRGLTIGLGWSWGWTRKRGWARAELGNAVKADHGSWSSDMSNDGHGLGERMVLGMDMV